MRSAGGIFGGGNQQIVNLIDQVLAVQKSQATLANQEKIMSALSDLQAAEAGVATAIASAITLIQSLQAGSVADADVEAIVAQLNAASASLTGALTPAAPTGM